MSSGEKNFTPLMKQYHDIKQQYPEMLILFQVGDFYELFFDDAKKAAACLGIALTSRGKQHGEPIPLCGVPVHAVDYYVTKLVRSGFRVALCNQLHEAVQGKVVERGVTQVLTPGTLTDAKLLDAKSASYLFSFFPAHNNWGLLFGELLTAQLHATILPLSSEKLLENELARFFPDEILVPSIKLAKPFESYFSRLGYCITSTDFEQQMLETYQPWLRQQFKQDAILFIENNESLHGALANFCNYIRKNQESALEQFRTITFYQPEDFLCIDAATQRNLELIKNTQDGGRKNTLFEVLDSAATPMGSRLIKKWILRPLVKQEAIEQRLDVVEYYMQHPALIDKIKTNLAVIADIERVVGRIAIRRAQLHDYVHLLQTFTTLPQLYDILVSAQGYTIIKVIRAALGDFEPLCKFLKTALNTEITKDWIINAGFDERLDYVRSLVHNSTQLMLELEQREQHKTGIASLKVGYNNVHGYYIEVTKPNAHLVPDYFIRHQTLVGKERFTTLELKKLESEVIAAQTEMHTIEKQLFEHVKQEVALFVNQLRKMAQAIAHLDALLGLAQTAYQSNYVRPSFNADRIIKITDGRHPVIEKKIGHFFIPNSTQLTHEQSLWIITGPNMGGKSTYLRQVALINIMAQIGSFVPAKSAHVSLVDRVFTRIGASDNVAEGKSTFLVEMEETALICSTATAQSLIILDEVGRGTSTFDGLAIAQAVVEFLHTQIKARCLFATHYHELTALQDQFPGIVSYYAASKKNNDQIVLLYKIVQGVADGSFGIEVARLAELPTAVVKRARDILCGLEKQSDMTIVPAQMAVEDNQDKKDMQYEMRRLQAELDYKNQIVEQLRSVDFEQLSPKKAFDLLWQIKEGL